MTNIDPEASWADVPQLEPTQRVLAGPGGPLNLQATALAARTKQLRDDQAAATASLVARTQVSVKDFESLVTVKPDPNNPATWDWAPAIKAGILAAAGTYGTTLIFPTGVYATSPVYFDSTDPVISDITIDGAGSTLRCTGPRTRGTRFDWEYGVLNFHGQYVGAPLDVTLTQAVTERAPQFLVPDGTFFVPQEFYLVEVDPANDPDAGGNFSTKKLWKMLQVVTTTATSVTFDYVVGYDLAIGTVVRFRRVAPVNNVAVRNLTLDYARTYTPGDPTSQSEASSGVTFLLARDCAVDNITYLRNPKQAAHFELTHMCQATRVANPNAVETNSGGYCVQFEKSVYFAVSQCWDRRGRHTFDATASAYGTVSDCHGFDSQNVAFTTHGTFEHNITYDRCVGGFQLAGSGPAYGETAKSITVRNHVGPNYRGLGNVSGVSLYDCRFYSTSDINIDGFRASNTTFAFDTRFVNTSSESARPPELTGCRVTANSGFIQFMNGALTFRKCVISTLTTASFQTLDATPVAATGEVEFVDCDLSTASASNVEVTVALSKLTVRGGTMVGTILRIQGSGAQEYTFDRCLMGIGSRPAAQTLLLLDKSAGSMVLTFAPTRSSSSSGRHITAVANGATLNVRLRDAEVVGGSVRIDNATLSSSGSLISTGMVWRSVAKTLPPADSRVVYGTELNLT